MQVLAVFVAIKAVALGAIVALEEVRHLPPLADLLALGALALAQLGLLAVGLVVLDRVLDRPASGGQTRRV